MAVPCPSCHREYDITLFEFGRTIWCTCGSRVGLEPRVRHVAPPGEHRTFAADVMLGRLARWLRLLGFDCAYDAAATRPELVRRAIVENRTILTCDRGLSETWRIEHVQLVREARVADQLREVIEHFELAPSIRPLTRCGACNGVLRGIAGSDVAGRVPAGVLERHTSFSECPGCARVYWGGTHARRIRALAESLVAS